MSAPPGSMRQLPHQTPWEGWPDIIGSDLQEMQVLTETHVTTLTLCRAPLT